MKQFNKKFILSFLTIISLLIVTLFSRLWRVAEAPASVNWDEAALGYNAYSMLKTGKDEFGKPFPVSLRSFDDYKPALYSYLSVVPIAIFGLGEISTRFTSILAGTLLVFAVLYIAAKLSGNFRLGLMSGLFVAFSPWAMHFSRIAFESNLAAAIYFLAIAAFLKSPKLSLMLFILSMYAYHSQRAIALPTFVLLLWINKVRYRFKWNWIFLGLIPLAYSFLIEPAGSRLSSTILLKLWPFVPAGYPWTVFSPLYAMSWQIVGQYLAYFSPINLFVKGSNEPILRIPTLGLLTIELMPLWILGISGIFKKSKLNNYLRVILILAPLPAVITWNWFSVVRTLAIYPAMAIIAALGYKFLNKFWKLVFWGAFTLSGLYTLLTIGIYAPYETYGEFQPGFEQLVPYVLHKSNKYDEVDVDTGQATPYIFFLFYGKYPPGKYLSEARRDLKHTENYGYRFGKFVFRKIDDYELYRKDVLLVGQTYRLKDSEINHIKKEREINVKDFYDPGGYISVRVVEL